MGETSAAFEPSDPGFEERTRRNFLHQGFMHTLGVTMSLLKAGQCELTLEFDEALTQQHDFFHGGVIATLADVSGGYAAFTLLAPEQTTSRSSSN